MKQDKAKRVREDYDATEDSVAMWFTEFHPDLRWCQIWGKWLIWNESVWRIDETIHVYDKIRRFCRNSSEFSADKKKMCSAAFVSAVERLSRSDRRYSAVPDQFDKGDWILNTPAGLVDLETGKLRCPDAKEYCTKITPVAPSGSCHRWQKFLSEITDGDVECIDYLQRLVGYCLTGSTREHSLHFLYGTGGNGKSVFLDTITGVMGDYAKTAPMETFTESHNDRHPTELAMLEGARVVVANETEQGKRWAQSRIKALTGGDMVAARYMRKNFFEYRPKFKLVIAGNAKPKLDTVDEAMRRRFHIIPFTVQIPAETRDKDLTRKLQVEWPGILAWATEGCLEYQKKGLAPPANVVDATNSYLESQDVFSEWLENECESGAEYSDTPTLLYNSWRSYAEASRERVGERAAFNERMEAAGYAQRRDRIKGRYWVGIRARPTQQARHV